MRKKIILDFKRAESRRFVGKRKGRGELRWRFATNCVQLRKSEIFNPLNGLEMNKFFLKVLESIAVACLVDKGRLDYSEKVWKYWPGNLSKFFC